MGLLQKEIIVFPSDSREDETDIWMYVIMSGGVERLILVRKSLLAISWVFSQAWGIVVHLFMLTYCFKWW